MENEPNVKSQRKERIKAILLGAKQVVGILQGVAEDIPVAKACISALSVVISLELDRQDNDEQIVLVYQSMTTMAEALTHLSPALMRNESLALRLQGVLEAMQIKIDEFSTFSRRYYRGKIARFIGGTSFKTELQAYASAFTKLQQDLLLLLAVRTALTATDILDNLAVLSAESGRRNGSFDQSQPIANDGEVADKLNALSIQLDAAKVTVANGVEHWEVDSPRSASPQANEPEFLSGQSLGSDNFNVVAMGETALEVSQHLHATQQRLEVMGAIIENIRTLLASQPRNTATSVQPTSHPPMIHSSPPPLSASGMPTVSPVAPLPPSVSVASGQYTALLHKSASQLHRQLDFDVGGAGPDHQRTWTISVRVDGRVCGMGQAAKKADAKEHAARVACSALGWV